MTAKSETNLAHLCEAANLYIEDTKVYTVSIDEFTNYAAPYLTTELLPLIVTHMEHLYRNRTPLPTENNDWPYYLLPNKDTVFGHAVARIPEIPEPDIGVLSQLFRRTLETDLFTIQDSPRSFVYTPYLTSLIANFPNDDPLDDEDAQLDEDRQNL